MGQDPSVHAIPASQRELCSEISECVSFFPNRVFISCEPNLCLTAPRSTRLLKTWARACLCVCVCVCVWETQSMSSWSERIHLSLSRNRIVSLFYPAFFFLNAAGMFISLHRDRYPWRNRQNGLNIGPLPVITLQAGALVPRCCLESINRRCRKVTLLLQCCTISL